MGTRKSQRITNIDFSILPKLLFLDYNKLISEQYVILALFQLQGDIHSISTFSDVSMIANFLSRQNLRRLLLRQIERQWPGWKFIDQRPKPLKEWSEFCHISKRIMEAINCCKWDCSTSPHYKRNTCLASEIIIFICRIKLT